MSTSGLDKELAAAASRRWWNTWTIVLAVVLLLVGGFVGGIEMQKAYGVQTSTTGSGGGGFRGQGGFTPPTAFPGGGSANGGGQRESEGETATGTVKLVDGTTIYVETESGEVVTVRTDGDTAVRIPGKLSSLKAGDKVNVDGDTGEEGSVTASSITRTD